MAPDLRGYGRSSISPSRDGEGYSKRVMAADIVALMRELGHERFRLAGHDRGARVGYRLALDHPERIERLAVLDIVPTAEVWARADDKLAMVYWHWGFLAQPAPLPRFGRARPGLGLGQPGWTLRPRQQHRRGGNVRMERQRRLHADRDGRGSIQRHV